MYGSQGHDFGDSVSELLGLLNPPEWHPRAACKGLDPEMFFPGRGEPTAPAMEVCRTCPVRAVCLESSLIGTSEGEKFGIWGGLSERARREIRRRRHQARRRGAA